VTGSSSFAILKQQRFKDCSMRRTYPRFAHAGLHP
jgi:hypothetical protein